MALAHSRPIEGAVATVGVSERVAFLRRTYAHLGIALVAWIASTALLFRGASDFSLSFSSWALTGYNWLAVIGAFMVIGFITDRLAQSESSKGLQYVGLFGGVLAWTFLLQPLLWLADASVTNFGAVVGAAALITGLIFVGLTLTVFVTKKEFSFMRGALMIATFAALGVIIASIIFGFHLGAIFAGVMILLMSGYILYQTSLVMQYFPPTMHVAAALMLFSTVATLFWYVLQLVMSLSRE